MFLSIKRINSNDFPEIKKVRPSLEARRALALTLTRSLLTKQGFLSYEQAKKVEIHRLKSGKPFLKFSQNPKPILPSISISHSGSWVGCLLSDKEIPAGLDIEDLTINRPYKQLSEYAFSKEENQFVSETGQLGFYQLWTAKEAIAKCNGEGLSYAIKLDLGTQLETPSSHKAIIVRIKNRSYDLYQQIVDDSLVVTLARKKVSFKLKNIPAYVS
jgi:4'-phosphopantetheinyl transferase